MVSIPKFHYSVDKNAKVAICVPVRDLVTAKFTYSLAMLTKKCGETNKKISIHMNMGSEVAMQRQQLAMEALETDCTHILWLDSDMTFPTHTIQALLSHDTDIVACNYSTRVPPYNPVAFMDVNNLEYRAYDGTGLHEIAAVGMGCMLVKRNVFETMEAPYFSVIWNDDYTNLIGEDFYFCTKAKDAGFSVMLDKDLSKHITHIGTKEFTIKGE
jgi:GT2 family glycosyltransferase